MYLKLVGYLKKWANYYELFLFKRLSLDGKNFDMSPVEGEIVLFSCSKKTEEEVYNFVIDYINNAENIEKQKSLVDEFKKGIQ